MPIQQLKAFVMAGHHDKGYDALVKDASSKTETHVLLTYASMERLRVAYCPRFSLCECWPTTANVLFRSVLPARMHRLRSECI